ncbi:MAG TPA: TlpA disulfide reductase family protein [Pirellulales bacterium]|jgi:thiol-disulfide isomerase/thioredoxin|nr:TlpA disulfide reductase family protein [Pirellulales bacterium]
MRHAKASCILAAIGFLAFLTLTALAPAADPAKPKADDNPYAPRKGLSNDELRKFIEHLQDAPSSLHERPGFAQGMLEAANQLLRGKLSEADRRFAVLAKFAALHQMAVNDEKDADKNLAAAAKEYRDSKDAEVAKQAKFYLLEQRVLAADDLKPEELPKLLAEVKSALSGESLDNQHLRIASATIRMVNRLNDDELAARSYKEFGEMFSKSDDSELSAYGRQIEASEPPVSLVGKPFPLEGLTVDGTKFNIEQYRGRVVLVDFWATWCGPCRAKLPGLMKLHEKFHAKGFEVVGVDLDKTIDDLGKFLDDTKLPWINLIGEKDGDEMKFPMAEKYDISAIPDTFLIGRDGRVIAHNPSDDELAKKLEVLLKPGQPAATKPAEPRKKNAKDKKEQKQPNGN